MVCKGLHSIMSSKKTLAVNDGRARRVVLVIADPHRTECREGRQDGATYPSTVLSFMAGNDLALECIWYQSIHVGLESAAHGVSCVMSAEVKRGVKRRTDL